MYVCDIQTVISFEFSKNKVHNKDEVGLCFDYSSLQIFQLHGRLIKTCLLYSTDTFFMENVLHYKMVILKFFLHKT
jgi:hypothetical protein